LNINPDFTFGYEFLTQSAGGQRLKSSRQLLQFNHDSLLQLEKDFTGSVFKLKNLVQMIKQITIQALWNNSPLVQFQSPLKKNNQFHWNQTIKIRNYLFVVGELPKNSSDLKDFTGADLHWKANLDFVKDSLLLQETWVDLMKERIAIYWLDLTHESSDLQTPTLHHETNQIRNGKATPETNIHGIVESYISVLLRQFGGNVIPYQNLISPNFPEFFNQIQINQIEASKVKPNFGVRKKEYFLDLFQRNDKTVYTRAHKSVLATLVLDKVLMSNAAANLEDKNLADTNLEVKNPAGTNVEDTNVADTNLADTNVAKNVATNVAKNVLAKDLFFDSSEQSVQMNCALQDDIQKVLFDGSLLEAVRFIGFKSYANVPLNTSKHWICSPKNEATSIGVLGLIFNYCRAHNQSLLFRTQKDSNDCYGVLEYNLPNQSRLKFFNHTVGLDDILTGSDLSNESFQSDIEPVNINKWFSKDIPTELKDFIERGMISNVDLTPFLFGLYDFTKEPKFQSPIQKKKEKEKKVPKIKQIAETIAVNVSEFNTLDELFVGFKELYFKVLYERVIAY
jgi:hypothetical protein